MTDSIRVLAVVILLALWASGATGCVDQRAETVKTLQQKYRGSITPGIHGAESAQSVRRMEELMAEWNPVGYRRADVKAILGEGTAETEEHLDYRFDSGLGGWQWRFELKGDQVVSVDKTDLD